MDMGVDDVKPLRHELTSLKNYNHPFQPYDIQIDLMNAIYDTINNDYKVGIFESPTGTGKTLSIICSSMTWIRDYKKSNLFTSESKSIQNFNNSNQDTDESNDSDSDSDDEPEWVKKAYEESIILKTKGKAEEYEIYLDELSKEYDQQIKREKIYDLNHNSQNKRRKLKVDESIKNDNEFILDDYYSDSENSGVVNNTVNDQNVQLTNQIQQLLHKVSNSKKEPVELINECPTTIYYSSRTHSQLNQFSDQLTLTKFDSSLRNIDERIKYLPLGSRKQLCINPQVSKLSNLNNINDACIDLQKSKDHDKNCKYLPKLNDSNSIELVKKFSNLSFTKIHDIEDLADLGNHLKICPYYSVRKGVEMSEIIALPYQMLLQESTREIMNLKIDNSIIIIDEAHNLLDVISSMNSISISEHDCNNIINALKLYLKKFLKKLNSGNRINLMKLIKICQLITNFFRKNSTILKNGDEILINDLFEGNTGDLLNVYKLDSFLGKSKIAYKLESYMDKLNSDDKENSQRSSSNPLLFKITQFLKKLNNPSSEGKFFWDNNKNQLSINYMLLDPSEIFRDLVNRSKCILLCGGTMEPMSDYKDFLFPYVQPDKIKTFSCGHIIPSENLKVFPFGRFNNVNFEFTFDKRNNKFMIEELGEALIRLTQNVPHGVVVFFPSYKYLGQVLDIWQNSTKKIYFRMNQIKKIFKEQNEAASNKVENVLVDYTNTIKIEKKGSILFSVVGGKMSEGINFSDELARAVIMIGLPFPNAFSGELKAKRNYIYDSSLSKGASISQAKENAKNFYENICMRAINQSIGRSIRHINDYSVIYLIDTRYSMKNIQQKLSGWVKDRISVKDKLYPIDEIMNETSDFFNSKLVNKLI